MYSTLMSMSPFFDLWWECFTLLHDRRCQDSSLWPASLNWAHWTIRYCGEAHRTENIYTEQNTPNREQIRNGQSPSLGFKQSVRKSGTSDNRGICGNCGSPQEWFFNNWFDQKQNTVEPQEVSASDVVCSFRNKSKRFTVVACKNSGSFHPSSCRWW